MVRPALGCKIQAAQPKAWLYGERAQDKNRKLGFLKCIFRAFFSFFGALRRNIVRTAREKTSPVRPLTYYDFNHTARYRAGGHRRHNRASGSAAKTRARTGTSLRFRPRPPSGSFLAKRSDPHSTPRLVALFFWIAGSKPIRANLFRHFQRSEETREKMHALETGCKLTRLDQQRDGAIDPLRFRAAEGREESAPGDRQGVGGESPLR
jgi:hypothetical protein